MLVSELVVKKLKWLKNIVLILVLVDVGFWGAYAS